MDEMNRETHRQEDTKEIDLVQLALDFFRIAKKRWWLFAGFLAVGTVIAFGVSFIWYTPLYRCEATFTVSTGGKTPGFTTPPQRRTRCPGHFPTFLDSSYFRSVLLDTLETDTLNGEISAETIENSNMVTMTVSSPSPEDARSILEAALSVYPEVSRFVLGDIELNLIDEIQTPTSPYNVPSKKTAPGLWCIRRVAGGFHPDAGMGAPQQYCQVRGGYGALYQPGMPGRPA